MRKIYSLNQKRNFSSIILTGQGGNRVRYEFKGGSVIQNIPASFITDNQYEQDLLEQSPLFKKGIIKLSQVINDNKGAHNKKFKPIDSVAKPMEAIEWVANNLSVKVTSGIRALETARKHGYDFPNFKA